MRQAMRRTNQMRLPVVVASPNVAAYFWRSADTPIRCSAASSFAISLTIAHLC
jgi:hypothetical protein